MDRYQSFSLSEYRRAGDKREEYGCPICKDKGVFFESGIAYPCSCKKNELIRAKKEKAGITPHLLKQTFDAFDLSVFDDEKHGANQLTQRENMRRIKEFAMDFVDEVAKAKDVSGMLFEGPVGSGKTFLAAACANALVEKGIDVRFLVVPDFLDLIRDTFRSDSEISEEELMQDAKNVDVLILDDLGAHNYTDWSVKTIFAVLNYRLNYEKPVIVTTNLDRREIENNLGSRIYSRLAEACRFIRFDNQDIRILQRMKTKGRG